EENRLAQGKPFDSPLVKENRLAQDKPFDSPLVEEESAYLPALGLTPSTKTSPSRSASRRTDLNPSASSAVSASPDAAKGGPLCDRVRSDPSPPRGAAPTTIARPPGRSTRTSSRIDSTRSSARIVPNRPPVSSTTARSNWSASSGSFVVGATSTSTRTPADAAPFRARAADDSSGAIATARPDNPTLA